MANPQLGYGKPSEATINQVNQWMRSQPWWAEIKGRSGGDLSKGQRDQILRAAQKAGVVVDEGDMEIDKGGNINPKGHKLRNTLIVAGIAGATIATMGAAGAFSGAAAGAGGAASGAGGAAAALGPSTAANLAATASIAGGSTVPASLAATGAGGGFLSSLGHFATSNNGLSLGQTLIGTATNIYGANRQIAANDRSAQLQADAARYATDAQKEAADKAERFTREQAQYGWRNDELNRHANYDQWAARQRGVLGTLGQYVQGYEIPEYVASEDPRFTEGGGAAPGGASGGGADPKVASFIANWQHEHPASEGIAPLSAALKAAGLGGDRFMYGNTPSNNELVVGGQKYKVIGGENGPNAAWFTPGTDDSAPGRLAAPGGPRLSTLGRMARPEPYMQIPTSPYQPGSLGTMWRG